jgi:hypothetical protein
VDKGGIVETSGRGRVEIGDWYRCNLTPASVVSVTTSYVLIPAGQVQRRDNAHQRQSTAGKQRRRKPGNPS